MTVKSLQSYKHHINSIEDEKSIIHLIKAAKSLLSEEIYKCDDWAQTARYYKGEITDKYLRNRYYKLRKEREDNENKSVNEQGFEDKEWVELFDFRKDPI
jgi:hypothetical protein